ncbi:MAG TPA: hypothetical protein VFQ91_25765 [Bryobacteraceae bacterium]|nr:hypothetical protein [Bryobacteraceae bacterium]
MRIEPLLSEEWVLDRDGTAKALEKAGRLRTCEHGPRRLLGYARFDELDTIVAVSELAKVHGQKEKVSPYEQSNVGRTKI